MIIKNHSQLEAKELIEQLLDNPFLLKHQYEELCSIYSSQNIIAKYFYEKGVALMSQLLNFCIK